LYCHVTLFRLKKATSLFYENNSEFDTGRYKTNTSNAFNARLNFRNKQASTIRGKKTIIW
jgi:hypothetical protein